MYDVICVGSATLDVFAHTDKSQLIRIKTGLGEEELIAYPSGTKIPLTSINFTSGGGGTNTATAFARLGLKTGFVGCLGNDEHSAQVLSLLEEEGIDFLGVQKKGVGGYSIILDSVEHDRTILTFKGVNDSLEFKSLDKNPLKAKWFYFSSMMGKSLHALELLAIHAKRKKAKLCFNPSCYLAEARLHETLGILKYTDILVLNREEAGLMVGNDEIPKMMKQLLKYVPLAVITDGKNGAWACDGKHIYRSYPHRVKVVESTGAGDAFASTFLWGLIVSKGSMLYALRAATANAESVITHHGAKNKLLTAKELKARVRRNPARVEKKTFSA